MVLQNCTKRTADIRRKEVVGEFKNIGFDIEIDANLKMVNSLDITLDLYSDSYKPYKNLTIVCSMYTYLPTIQ